MKQLKELANRDPLAIRWAGGCRFTMMFAYGEACYRIAVEGGKVSTIEALDYRLHAWDFAVSGEEEAWQEHWAPTPRPTFHDIIAMRTAGHITIEGNLHPFLCNILYVKRLLELPRSGGFTP